MSSKKRGAGARMGASPPGISPPTAAMRAAVAGEADEGSLGCSDSSGAAPAEAAAAAGAEAAAEPGTPTAAAAPVGLSSALFPGPSLSTAATTTRALPLMTSLTAPCPSQTLPRSSSSR